MRLGSPSRCAGALGPMLAGTVGAACGPATTVMGAILYLPVPPLSLCPARAESHLLHFASEEMSQKVKLLARGCREPPGAQPFTPQLPSLPSLTPQQQPETLMPAVEL